MSSVLSAKNIIKRYRNPVISTILNGISLEIQAGETVAIMGKSGEGKTTLLHILGTLDPPTEGSLKICGIPSLPQNQTFLRNKKIGFVFQFHHLLYDYTVLENVLMPAKIGKQKVGPGSEAYQRALALLNEVGLFSKAAFPTYLLSGGEKTESLDCPSSSQ